MTKIRLLVVGAGGHGRSVAEAAELSGRFEVVGLLDDSLTAGESVLGVPVLGPVVSMAHHRQVSGKRLSKSRGCASRSGTSSDQATNSLSHSRARGLHEKTNI